MGGGTDGGVSAVAGPTLVDGWASIFVGVELMTTI